MNLSFLVAVLMLGAAPVEPSMEVRLTQIGPNKILVIKHVRAATGLGLKETKDLVERAPCVVLTSNAGKAEALAADLKAARASVELVARGTSEPSAAPVLAERPQAVGHQVRLTVLGPNKIQVIKVLREATGLGLREAKDLAERAPCVVKESLAQDAAERLVAKLRAAGAQAETGP